MQVRQFMKEVINIIFTIKKVIYNEKVSIRSYRCHGNGIS
mgnify:CR=1 FL=1